MNSKKVVNLLVDKPNVLDFFSVVFWYRDVWLFYLDVEYDYNKVIKTLDNELLEAYNLIENQDYNKSIKIINDYLNNNFINYEIAYWFNWLFFVYKKDAKTKINNLLKKYKNPINTLEWWRDLWLLLSFPKCCVKQFYSEKVKSEHTTKLILDKKYFNIPFSPCKEECWDKWVKYYDEIDIKLKG